METEFRAYYCHLPSSPRLLKIIDAGGNAVSDEGVLNLEEWSTEELGGILLAKKKLIISAVTDNEKQKEGKQGKAIVSEERSDLYFSSNEWDIVIVAVHMRKK